MARDEPSRGTRDIADWALIVRSSGVSHRAGAFMDDIDSELRTAIARDRAARARAMDPAAKLVAGARLFDTVRERMLAGIRSHHPSWSPDEVEAEFRRRVAMLREREERGVFMPVGRL